MTTNNDDRERDVQFEHEELMTEVDPHPQGRLQRFWDRIKHGDPSRSQTTGQQTPTKDRTRSAVVLAGSVIVAGIVALGLLSSQRQSMPRTKPNLGRPPQQLAAQNQGSIAPLMSAQPQTEEPDNDLDPADIANTARPRQTQAHRTPPEAPPAVQPSPPRNYALNQIPHSDPALDAEYWRRQIQNRATPEAAPAGNPNLATQQAQRELEGLRKASLVFVRQGNGVTPAAKSGTARMKPVMEHTVEEYLPTGTKLVARLQDAVTSAVKMPVVAVIEYHYERDGEIVVPAGTRAIGEMQQANQHGVVGLKFHTLEFADGHREKIEGAAINLDHGPLKGQVTGSNRGKRMLARTLTGIGTMAAYVVGGGGYRLGGPMDNSVFLRERLAQNVGMAGEQEVMALGYGQNVVVTIPGNTRFYLMMQRQAGESSRYAPAGSPRTGNSNLRLAHSESESPLPTAAELRELVALKQELTNLYLRTPVSKTVEAPPAQ